MFLRLSILCEFSEFCRNASAVVGNRNSGELLMIRIFGLNLLAMTVVFTAPLTADDPVDPVGQPEMHARPWGTNARPFRLFRRGNWNRARYASKEDRINHAKFELATERYPKFYGGFHSSHFSNLGAPTGDLGFRGNGVYWAPW